MATILIVDDDSLILDELKSIIEDMGHKPILAGDGMQAFFKFKNQKFDVVVTDLNMPKSSGLELIKSIKSHKVNSEVPIIVNSGSITDFAAELTLIENLQVLEKPFDEETFTEALTIALEKSQDEGIQKERAVQEILKLSAKTMSDTLHIICKQEPIVSPPIATKGPFGFSHQYSVTETFSSKELSIGLLYSFNKEFAWNILDQLKKDVNKPSSEEKSFETMLKLTDSIGKKMAKTLSAKGMALNRSTPILQGSSGSKSFVYCPMNETCNRFTIETNLGVVFISVVG